VLNPIANLTNNELVQITFTATAMDSDLPAQSLAFRLDSGAPAGATINANSGDFTWTPTEAQGPSTNPVRVIVTDNGTPPMSATQQVIIVVNEVNVAPVLDPIANQTNNELTLITFMATATDSDLPGQTLSFSLDGARRSSHQLGQWRLHLDTDRGARPSTNPLRVIVTDNGTPPLTATQSLTLVVKEVNVSPVLSSIGDRTVKEGTQLTFTANATDSDLPRQYADIHSRFWRTVRGEHQSGQRPLYLDASAGSAPATNSMTVRVTDNGIPALSAAETISIIVSAQSPPTVALTNPVNNSVFLPGAPITLSASASAPGGTVAKWNSSPMAAGSARRPARLIRWFGQTPYRNASFTGLGNRRKWVDEPFGVRLD